jgi:hypothetical protein
VGSVAPARNGGALRLSTYWSAARTPRYSLLFALPLFLLYEAMAAGLSGEAGAHVRNAADVALKTPFLLFAGSRGSLALFATVIAAFAFVVGRDIVRSKEPLRGKTFALMLGESAVLALLLGIVVGTITQRLLAGLSVVAAQSADGSPLATMGMGTRLMLALGAGLYEELLFRVLLVGGMAAGLRWLLGGHPVASGVAAALIGALMFSAFHYVGEYGDTFTIASFTYRAIAGLAFSGLYLTRGFGITSWTHALYDVYVMVI